MATSVALTSAGASLGRAEAALFGGNLLIDRDRFGDGTYDEAVRGIGLTALRYPGGTVTERYFDMADPDRARVWDSDLGAYRDLLPLSDFLAGAEDLGLGVCLVLPTRDLLAAGPAGARVPLADTFAQVEAYVGDVLAGIYGPATVETLEIGNEYWLSGEMDVAEYARLASVMAEAAQAAIDAHAATAAPGWVEPKIAVQVGQYGAWSTDPGWIQNAVLMEALSDRAAEAVDAVIAHYYAAGAYGDLGSQGYLFDRMAEWERNPRYAGIETHVTEWNTAHWNSPETGMKQASALLFMVSEMVIAGVDAAYVWPVQQNVSVTLSDDEGDADLRIAGETLRLLSESLPGMDLMARANFAGGTAYLYDSAGQSVVLLASRLATAQEIALDLGAMGLSGQSYRFRHLGTEGDPTAPTAAPSLLLDARVQVAAGSGLFDLGAYGVLRIDLVDDPARLADPVLTGSAGADTLIGSAADETLAGGGGEDDLRGGWGNDRIDGGDGADRIHAGAGDDVVLGGNGRDVVMLGDGDDHYTDNLQGGFWGMDSVRGGRGKDTIDGGAGDDSLYGGGGADWLDGNGGNDRLEGGAQADVMNGGTGDDSLFGGGGADRLTGGSGADSLVGGSGSDHIDSGAGDDRVVAGSGHDRVVDGAGADRLWLGSGDDRFDDAMADGTGADTVYGGSGNDRLIARDGDDRLFGGSGDDLVEGGAGADTLKGGAGADTVRGGAGNDRLEGGAGADRFVFGPSDGADIVVDYGDGDVIRIEGVGPEDLDIVALSGGALRLSFGVTEVTLLAHADLPEMPVLEFL